MYSFNTLHNCEYNADHTEFDTGESLKLFLLLGLSSTPSADVKLERTYILLQSVMVGCHINVFYFLYVVFDLALTFYRSVS